MKLTQTDRRTASMLTKNFTTLGDYDLIISIVCPDDDSIKPINNNHLVVKMWDIDKPLENKFRKYEPPSYGDCSKVIEFVNNFLYENRYSCGTNINVLVHCDAGVSRSSAIALGLLWEASSFIFTEKVFEDDNGNIIKEYIRARKEYCANLVDEGNGSHFLKWFVEGKNLMRGVKPNQAILRNFRNMWANFPW
jgi:protein tyrosine phosphatase